MIRNSLFRVIVVSLFICLLPELFATQLLRVLCLNAEWFPGRSPEPSELAQKIHLCQVRKLLIDINPDVLVLQEARHAAGVDELISVLPDFTVHTMSEFGGQQELVIAARFEALAGWAERWQPHPEYFQPRGLAFAVLSLPTDEALAVYTVHFKSNYQAGEDQELKKINTVLREASARQLVEHIHWVKDQDWELPLTGVIVGGDINTTYPRPLNFGEQTFKLMKQGDLLPMGLPGIDHFLTRGDARQGRAAVLTDYRVSDHQPILFELSLGKDITWPRAEPIREKVDDDVSCIAIDINRTSAADLRILPGIGPILSRRIVENRPYRSLQELRRVPGIGPVTLERIRPLIYIDNRPEP